MRVWVNGITLTEVGGETGIDHTVVVSPAHATNKAKGKDLLTTTTRFALYRYRTTLTGTTAITVEAVDVAPTKALSIDKIIVRTEPRSVEMYEVEKDYDDKSDTHVRVDNYSILVTGTVGYFDINHYAWGVPLTIEVVAKGPSSVISLTCDSQLVGTATLTTGYAVYAFNWDPGSEGQMICRIQSGNTDETVRVDKLLVKENLPVYINTAPTGYFTIDSIVNGSTIIITATAIVTDPDGDAIASYFWDFGNGESYCSGNPVVTHTYTYAVSEPLCLLTLYVTDHRGKTAVIDPCVYLPVIMKIES